MILKILSWNVWIDGYFDQAKDFLKNINADIIGLQEVKDDDSQRDFIGFLKSLGYEYVFGPAEKTWGGNIYRDGPAIFSKFPIKQTKIHILSTSDTRVAVQAEIQIEGKIFHVFSAHLLHTHQQDSSEQVNQIENLIKVLPKEKTIVMGDFNAEPKSKTMKMMRDILEDTDSQNLPTWSNYLEGCPKCAPQGIDIRLDYIFISKDLSVKAYKVEDSIASDHLPITAEIEI